MCAGESHPFWLAPGGICVYFPCFLEKESTSLLHICACVGTAANGCHVFGVTPHRLARVLVRFSLCRGGPSFAKLPGVFEPCLKSTGRFLYLRFRRGWSTSRPIAILEIPGTMTQGKRRSLDHVYDLSIPQAGRPFAMDQPPGTCAASRGHRHTEVIYQTLKRCPVVHGHDNGSGVKSCLKRTRHEP